MTTTAKTWRLIVLAAVLIHLIALAGWQMVRRRQPQPESLRAADDTPILLQFSREEPLAQAVGTIPLPPAAPLPPPHGGSSPTEPTPAAKADRPGTAAALPGRPAATPPPGPGKGASAPRPGAGQAPTRQARAQGGGTPGSGPATAIPALALGSGSAARIALENGVHDARTTAAEEPQEPGKDLRADQRSAGSGTGSEGESRSSAEDRGRAAAGIAAQQASAADQRLWSQARPGRTTPGSLEGLPAGVAVRELSFSQAQRSGADLRHRRLVRFEDGLLLIWVEGSRVWLVRSPLP